MLLLSHSAWTPYLVLRSSWDWCLEIVRFVPLFFPFGVGINTLMQPTLDFAHRVGIRPLKERAFPLGTFEIQPVLVPGGVGHAQDQGFLTITSQIAWIVTLWTGSVHGMQGIHHTRQVEIDHVRTGGDVTFRIIGHGQATVITPRTISILAIDFVLEKINLTHGTLLFRCSLLWRRGVVLWAVGKHVLKHGIGTNGQIIRDKLHGLNAG